MDSEENNNSKQIIKEYLLDYPADLTIVIKHSNMTTRFLVHKSILSSHSPVWKAILQWNDDDVFKITSISVDEFEFLLTYMYTSKFFVQSLSSCLNILILADYFFIQSLIDHCQKYLLGLFLSGTIDTADVIDVLNVAVILVIQSIIDTCLGYIADNPKRILGDDMCLALDSQVITYLAQLDCHVFPEPILLHIILRHAEHERGVVSLRDELDRSGHLRLVRFKSLILKNLTALHTDYPTLLTTDEYVSSLESLIDGRAPPPIFDILSEPRGHGKNKVEFDCVTVASPPFTIMEEWIYMGMYNAELSLISLELEWRHNSFDPMCFRDYEESITLRLFNMVYNFDCIVSRSQTILLTFPAPIIVRFVEKGRFQVEITFNRPGTYRMTQLTAIGKMLFFRKITYGIIKRFNIDESYTKNNNFLLKMVHEN